MAAMTDEECIAALEMVAKHGSLRGACRAEGISRDTLRSRVATATRRGFDGPAPGPVAAGFEIKRMSHWQGADGEWKKSVTTGPEKGEEFEPPSGMRVVKGTVQLGPDNRIERSWPRYAPGERDPEELGRILKEAFETCKGGAKPAKVPKKFAGDKLAFFPLADLHLGMHSWKNETGHNWNLKKGLSVISDSFNVVMDGSQPSGTAVLLGGGDSMHADNNRNQTAKSANPLDVDGRYAKVLLSTCHLFVEFVDLALLKHGKVILRVLPGNHDEHAAHAISYFCQAWFRNEPRVTVDIDPGLFWWYRHGETFLGSTHGHEAKPRDMPGIMAYRRKKDWGMSTHRYIHMFHRHHKEVLRVNEREGVITETHQSPVVQDGWHFGCGFLSGRSMQNITYHLERGERGRVVDIIQDDFK